MGKSGRFSIFLDKNDPKCNILGKQNIDDEYFVTKCDTNMF